MAVNRMFRTTIVLLALGTALSGCGRPSATAYQTWAPKPAPDVIDTSSGNAFDTYRQAALDVESRGGKYLTRVSFYPGQRKAAADLVAEPFNRVVRATTLRCDFRFRPHAPFEVPAYHRGWRLLGRVFAWKVEDACKAEDYKAAVPLAIAGTRFAFDLCGGGAADGALGLVLADDIRKALAPSLAKMPPEQLGELSEGMRAALQRRTSLDATIQNERQNMLQAVQSVQDWYRAGQLQNLERLGSSARDGIDYLRNLAPSQGPDYFGGFAAEAEVLVRTYAAEAKMSALARRSEPEPKLSEPRPWKRLAKHFFGTLDPLLQISDATEARTRLLVLTARLLAGKSKGFPQKLPADPLAVDPFSGQQFLYHYDAAEFSLYSVGPNLKDDGGETDATFTNPDLTLER